MIEKLFKYPVVLARHKTAPLLKERECFLSHRAEQGYARVTLRKTAWELLLLTRVFQVSPGAVVTTEQLSEAADQWARRHSRRCTLSRRRARNAFLSVAIPWLRFIGCLREPEVRRTPSEELIDDFSGWMRNERGLSEITIRNRCFHVKKFLQWYQGRARPISAVAATDIDAFLAGRGAELWSRVSVATCAKALRAFFRHAGMRGWCPVSLAVAVEGPRIFAQEALPTGPAWEDVRRLLASMETDRPADVRDRPIAMLFAIYGLRSSEVSRLQLEDIDWERDLIRVWRAKLRRPQIYPLVASVGNAITQYLKSIRPRCPRREVFLALNAPFRPMSKGALYEVTSVRMAALGVRSRNKGPHALRHACAAHLVSGGLSLKEIGDHLGHRSSESTRIYAKVDLPGLREVGALDLGGLS